MSETILTRTRLFQAARAYAELWTGLGYPTPEFVAAVNELEAAARAFGRESNDSTVVMCPRCKRPFGDGSHCVFRLQGCQGGRSELPRHQRGESGHLNGKDES